MVFLDSDHVSLIERGGAESQRIRARLRNVPLREPTPFVWGGKRQQRRQRHREKRHRLGGSGGYTRISVRRRAKFKLFA